MNRFGAVVALTCSLLLAAGCGGGSTSDEGSPAASSAPAATASSAATSSASAAPEEAGSPDEAFCAGWDKNDGTLASIGEPPTFYPKDDLVTYAEETLAVMAGLTPPQAIAKEWTAYKQFQTRLLAAARSLEAGGRLRGTVPGREAVTAQYKKINAWISTNC